MLDKQADVIAKIFTEAKAGKDILADLDSILNANVPYKTLVDDGILDLSSMFSGPVANDQQAKECRSQFCLLLSKLFVKGALKGYVAGNHHKLVGQLIAHLCDRDYRLSGSNQVIQGGALWNYICKNVVRCYIEAGSLTSRRNAVLILSQIPDQQIRNSLAKRFPEELRPQAMPSAAFFQCRKDYYEQKRIHPLTLEKRAEMAKVSNKMFSL